MAQLFDIIIIGCGFSGLAMGLQLQRAGDYQFLILEKSERPGGTWRDNHYPGCECDVPSHLYSLSGHPKDDWECVYAGYQEILTYFDEKCDQLAQQIRVSAKVQEARFNLEENDWQITLDSGEVLRSRYLVASPGPLNLPHIPDIPGLDSFTGKWFHSMDWPDQFELAGKRVTVIGTGASAIQIVPAISTQVSELTIVQRSAPWVIKKGNRRYSHLEKWCFKNIPGWRSIYRSFLYIAQETRGLAFLSPMLMGLAELLAKRSLNRQIRDTELKNALTPDYRMGCKRIMLSDDYLSTLQLNHVKLISSSVSGITPTGFLTEDGHEHDAECLIFATGFHHQERWHALPLYGRHGVALTDHWKRRQGAYLGTMVDDFPNLFLMLGPNTGLGHNSILFMAEAQVHWIVQAIHHARRQLGNYLCLSLNAADEFSREMQSRASHTVWATGCKSWYLNEEGHNTALWPGLSLEFWWRTRRFNPAHFESSPCVPS